ncbi:hypothetical protein [Ferrimicrobium acidiphilum]|uniref:hypothetical protein n=1 Tax=Ferrimicrobium acidiphilum TaxID=121039 RepID=UPI003C6DA614
MTKSSKAPIGSAKTFRSYDQGQMFLIPPSLDDWLPKDHIARFISEVVDELLDLSVVYASYVEASGGVNGHLNLHGPRRVPRQVSLVSARQLSLPLPLQRTPNRN